MGSRIFVVLWLAAVAQVALADDIQPGLWEMSLETRIPAHPEYAPSAVTMKQCLTAQDAKDPSRVLGAAANPGATDCVYTDKRYAGSRFSFAMQCGGSLGIRAQGEISYSATSMEGSITSTATPQGQRIELENRLSAHRLGGC